MHPSQDNDPQHQHIEEIDALDEVPLPEELTGGLGDERSELDEDEPTKAHRQQLARRLEDRPPSSAMLRSFGVFVRWLASLLFAHVAFERRSVDSLQDASARGAVVYVMQSRSLLDYLYFNWAFLKHQLPLARFANDISLTPFKRLWAILRAPFSRSLQAPPEQQLEAIVRQGHAAFIFLERPHKSDEENLEYSQRYLYQLVRAQRRHPQPIQLVPLLLLWERRPDPQHVSFLSDVFGTTQRPGFLRKFLSYIQTPWQSFFNIGQPIVQVSTPVNLLEFLREYPNAGSADACELVRERLLSHIAQERLVILGPTGQPPAQIFKNILHRPELTRAIGTIAQRERVPEETIKRRARAYFDEIAAAQSLLVIKIFSMILGLIWYRIYDGFEVDEPGLDKVREAGKTSSLIIIPSHKSHIDYLIISYLFYQYGLVPPHIAAGVNLSFFPIGSIFRRSGAFFIRRSFKGEDLYPIVFREYLIALMQQSYPIEFFIEGTRSRTGKLIKPRYGMLEMIVQAFTSGRVDAVTIVPVSVGYEKIIESGSYKREILGGEKKKESLSELLKTPRFLASRYGRLYVQFAEPLSLSQYLERFGVDPLRPDPSALETLIVRLAHRIIYDINSVTAVTPTALVAMILLNNNTRHLDHERLLREAGFTLRFLTQIDRATRLSRTLKASLEDVEHLLQDGLLPPINAPIDREAAIGQAISSVVDEAIELFERNKLIETLTEHQERFYKVADEARVELSFYRNNIIHLFVPEALLSMALLGLGQARQSYEQARDETHFLSRLFKYEWIYEERAEFENVFARTLRSFEQAGWVKLHWDKDTDDEDAERPKIEIELVGEQRVELEFMRRIALTFLEAYALLTQRFDELSQAPQEREALLNKTLELGRSQFLKGRILYFESLSKPTLLNALRIFTDWGVLTEQRVPSGKKKELVTYTISEAWRQEQRYKELQQHLEAIVYRGEQPQAPKLLAPDQPA